MKLGKTASFVCFKNADPAAHGHNAWGRRGHWKALQSAQRRAILSAALPWYLGVPGCPGMAHDTRIMEISKHEDLKTTDFKKSKSL